MYIGSNSLQVVTDTKKKTKKKRKKEVATSVHKLQKTGRNVTKKTV